ncbi:hypothetical protein N7495_006812 [Penicillium taxi]|uniref:uncharacterized protein n=1 Tax=Penicillium taxi TaxID=168475 RepID=UPI0025450149|nr:uncharacterized protein N7495_006812 [Penicillium taxi]KAJ5895121.1 hypothetical protein N7495_006812 [Penicillium taxi]
MATLSFQLTNNTDSNDVYAYITGSALDSNNALFLLQSDGKTGYYPDSPSTSLSALAQDCAIKLGSPGNSISVTIPHLAGARLWFIRDSQLTFYLNSGPALVEPSSSNPSDPNYNLCWDFCEFTWNSSQLFANITYVDFVSLPISLRLTNGSGNSKIVSGLPKDGLNTICTALQSQNSQDNSGWDKLIITQNGNTLRAVSPNTGITLNSSLFNGYYDSYVNQVWSTYTNNTISVDTQGSAGIIQGSVASNQLVFSSDQNITYDKPSSADIFSNSSGAFAVSGNSVKDAITARLAAAFNRSTLLTNSNQPDGESVSSYYQNSTTNHYSRICHNTTLNGQGYAFPYDDVSPSDSQNVSGSVFDSNPTLLIVTVGGPSNDTTETAKSQENASLPPKNRNKGVVFQRVRRLMRRTFSSNN